MGRICCELLLLATLVGAASGIQLRAVTHRRAATGFLTGSRHVKLDVGFAAYEKNVTDAVLKGPLNVTAVKLIQGWTDADRKHFQEDVVKGLHSSWVSATAPLKKAIGKSWVSLKDDDGRDHFVEQLKGSFQGVYDQMFPSFSRNGQIMMNALKEYPPKSLSLVHAEDAMVKSFNKTIVRTQNSLFSYIDLDAKTTAFTGQLALIEVV